MASHALYAGVLGVIVLTLLTVSLSRLHTTRTKADYLVAGRSLPAFVLVFTLLSSWIGSGSLLGGAENAYNHGFAALWQGGGGWAGLLLIYFIAPRARKFAQFTIPDLLEARYNQTARVLGVIAILFAYTAITSYQLIGGGDILHLIFPDLITADLGKYIIAAFVIVFTAIAGMASVAYMDVVIGSLAAITLILALPFVLHAAGGWAGVIHALPATHFQVLGDFSLIQALELFLPHDAADAGKSIHVSEVFLRQVGERCAQCGRGMDHRHRDSRNSDCGTCRLRISALPYGRGPPAATRDHRRHTALHGLPAWLGALLMGAVFAKIISTANNYLFSPATNLVNDVFTRYLAPQASNKRVLIVSRLVVVMLGIWALYQAVNTHSVLAKTLYA